MNPNGRPGLFLMVNTLERGGTERQFVTLSQGSKFENFQLSTGCLSRRGAFVENLPEVKEFSPGHSLFKMRSLLTRAAMARHMRHEHVAVAHAFDFYSNMMLIPVARLVAIPVVIGSHRQLGDLMTPMQFRAQNAAFRWCDRVVCNSRAAADRLRHTGVAADKLVVIPNALPEEAFANTGPALPRESSKLRVGMIARMNDPSKNHRAFLQMAGRVAPKFPDVQFVLVGDGPLRPSLQTIANEAGLGSRILFLGDRRDIPAVLASLDITVLPSKSESLSNVILESMAAGVAVIATNVGGNSELVTDGETGFLTTDHDEALARAVETLLSNDELRIAFGRRARQQARAQYQLDVVRDRYEQLYLSALAAKVGRQQLRKARTPA